MPKREVTYDEQMLHDLTRWRDEDPDTGRRVVELIELTIAGSSNGRGRPKRIHSVPGLWSRRITRFHRLFYVTTGVTLRFISCWGHEAPAHVLAELAEKA